MRLNGSLRLIGRRSELMCLGPKFLQHEHSVMAVLLSLSIPGQNHLSRSFSLVWSHPKWPFSSWVFAASSTCFVFGTHSTHVALSVAFVCVYHSLPSSMVKFIAQCLARYLVQMSGMSWFVSNSTTSLSHGSSANCSCMFVHAFGPSYLHDVVHDTLMGLPTWLHRPVHSISAVAGSLCFRPLPADGICYNVGGSRLVSDVYNIPADYRLLPSSVC